MCRDFFDSVHTAGNIGIVLVFDRIFRMWSAHLKRLCFFARREPSCSKKLVGPATHRSDRVGQMMVRRPRPIFAVNFPHVST